MSQIDHSLLHRAIVMVLIQSITTGREFHLCQSYYVDLSLGLLSMGIMRIWVCLPALALVVLSLVNATATVGYWIIVL